MKLSASGLCGDARHRDAIAHALRWDDTLRDKPRVRLMKNGGTAMSETIGGPALNTDREIWRGPDEGNGDYYADSVHVTKEGAICIQSGGRAVTRMPKVWVDLAWRDSVPIK
jgi:hypothetical protein